MHKIRTRRRISHRLIKQYANATAATPVGNVQQLSKALGNNTKILTSNANIGNPNAGKAASAQRMLLVVKPFVTTIIKQNSIIFGDYFSSCPAIMISHSYQGIRTKRVSMG